MPKPENGTIKQACGKHLHTLMGACHAIKIEIVYLCTYSILGKEKWRYSVIEDIVLYKA